MIERTKYSTVEGSAISCKMLLSCLAPFLLLARLFGVFVYETSPRPQRVQVEIYYETLCPEVRDFFNDQLSPNWGDLNGIMDVHWIPYGKASVK